MGRVDTYDLTHGGTGEDRRAAERRRIARSKRQASARLEFERRELELVRQLQRQLREDYYRRNPDKRLAS